MRVLRTIKLVVVLGLAAAAVAAGAAPPRVLRLATTTSTDSTGLLDYLLPGFEARYQVKVQVIAVGTGKALKLAENGDVDVVMVHAPAAEQAFMEAGFGVNRRPFMKNDFILVGPGADPAGVKAAGNLDGALKAIKDSPAAVFISRGDDSGTHKKELELWQRVSGPPPGERYREAGQGMAEVLRMADEKGAYTLSDRGTWLALRQSLKLVVVFEGDPALENPYSMIAVNPARFPDANYLDAMALIAWLTSPEGQQKIGSFQVDGEVLFHPTAIPAGPGK